MLITESKLRGTHPELISRIRKLAIELERVHHLDLVVTQGLRSWREQAMFYEVGRTTPGKVVTNAAPGHSWHQYGLAVDCIPAFPNRPYDWNSEHSQWRWMEQIGKDLGLYTGAEFRMFPDAPHFQ